MPLGARRRRVRGYNQAEVVARQLARLVPSVPLLAGLSRVRETPPQVGRGAEQRRRNLAGAFAWTGPALGGTVWLVDDVVTTGATLSECAATLFDGGARIVSIVTFGRAPAAGDRV